MIIRSRCYLYQNNLKSAIIGSVLNTTWESNVKFHMPTLSRQLSSGNIANNTRIWAGIPDNSIIQLRGLRRITCGLPLQYSVVQQHDD